MTITLPENLSEITLDQFLKYEQLIKRDDLEPFELSKRIISVFTKISYHDVSKIGIIDYEVIVKQIVSALNQEVDFTPLYTLKKVELGFIPNLNEMSMGEFVDLSKYESEPDKLHNLMAILFRPVIKKDALGNYEIAPYTGSEEYAQAMKHLPMHIVNGALVFFYNLGTELEASTRRSTLVELAKERQRQTIS